MILSTTRPDGRPHAIPTWFWWSGDGLLYFITARDTQKARNLAAQPNVVAHFGDGDDVLFVEGRVEIVSDSKEKTDVDAGYRSKYIEQVTGERASVFDNPADDVYRVNVERVVTWMYGTVGGWTEWRSDEPKPSDDRAVEPLE